LPSQIALPFMQGSKDVAVDKLWSIVPLCTSSECWGWHYARQWPGDDLPGSPAGRFLDADASAQR